MRHYFLLIFVVCLSVTDLLGQANPRLSYTLDYSNAQQFLQDVNGRPLYQKVGYTIEGTPYHPETYYKATVVMPGGKAYRNIPVKFNLSENLLIYKNASGEELVMTVPAVRVIYTDTSNYGKMEGKIFERGYGSFEDLSPNTWYEVLDTGNVQLLKKWRVYYNDQTRYGNAGIHRVYGERQEFYISLSDGSIQKIGKGCDAILDILSDKKNNLKSFISKEDLKCRKEADLKKLIAYFNTLQ